MENNLNKKISMVESLDVFRNDFSQMTENVHFYFFLSFIEI